MNLAVEVILAWLAIVIGAAWLISSGWVLIGGGLLLLVVTIAASSERFR